MRLYALSFALALVAACKSAAPAATETAADVLEDTTATDAAAGTDAAAVDAAVEVTLLANTGGPDWNSAGVFPSNPGEATSGSVQAGVATVDVGSPIGVSMGGYGLRDNGAHTIWSDGLKASRGQYASLAMKALALKVKAETLIFVRLPLVTSDSALLDQATDKLLKRGLDLRGRIITSANHTHHGTARFWPIPDGFAQVGLDNFDAEVMDQLTTKLADVVENAVKDLQPAQWAWTSYENWDPDNTVYRDRRDDNDPLWGKDPRLTLVGVQRNGDLLATLVNFPVHGTAFDDDNDLYTEDAPGAVEQKIEEQYFTETGKPLTALFLQCAGGDASPAGDSLGHQAPARVEKVGYAAADLIVPKFKDFVWKPELQLAVRSIRLDFNHGRIYPTYPDLANEFTDAQGKPYHWGGWQCHADGVGFQQSMAGKSKNCIDLETLLPGMGGNLPHAEISQVLLTAARLGDLGLITLPGEPTYSLVQYAREHTEGLIPGMKKLMVVGYSQDYFLYLTAPLDWMLGGYEEEMSLWGPAGGQWFADQVMQLHKDLWAGLTLPLFWQVSPTLASPRPFTPRKLEDQLGNVEIVTQPPTEISRTQSLAVVFAGGDPALGTPLVELVRKNGADWLPVPSPDGHGTYDNRHGEMLTLYLPDPPQSPELLPARHHYWKMRWQVPAWLPSGQYALRATLPFLGKVPNKPVSSVLTTSGVQVHAVAGTALALTRVDATKLKVQMTVPGVEFVKDTVGNAEVSWPQAGWRLIDRSVHPQLPQTVRAPLDVTVDNGQEKQTVLAKFSVPDNAHVLTLPTLKGGTAGTLKISVQIHGGEGGDASGTVN